MRFRHVPKPSGRIFVSIFCFDLMPFFPVFFFSWLIFFLKPPFLGHSKIEALSAEIAMLAAAKQALDREAVARSKQFYTFFVRCQLQPPGPKLSLSFAAPPLPPPCLFSGLSSVVAWFGSAQHRRHSISCATDRSPRPTTPLPPPLPPVPPPPRPRPPLPRPISWRSDGGKEMTRFDVGLIPVLGKPLRQRRLLDFKLATCGTIVTLFSS